MQLVQEENDVPGAGDFVQNVFHALLKLAPILRPGDDGGQVQGQQALVGQRVRDLPQGHALGQGLHHGGLAHPGFAQQHGIVFGPAQ